MLQMNFMADSLSNPLTRRIDTPEELVEFLIHLKKPLSKYEEETGLYNAISCKGDFWQHKIVRDTVRAGGFCSDGLAIPFDLLTSTALTAEQSVAIDQLLAAENSHLFRSYCLPMLFSRLEAAKVLDVATVLLLKLDRRDLLEDIVLTLCVCAPSALSNSRLIRVASRSEWGRTLLQFFPRKQPDGGPESQNQIEQAVKTLSELDDSTHGAVLVDVGWIFLHSESTEYARAILGEMVRVKDHRDCEVLIHYFSPKREPRDLVILSELASGPNKRAASWAVSILQD
jgi:hypothetical protein